MRRTSSCVPCRLGVNSGGHRSNWQPLPLSARPFKPLAARHTLPHLHLHPCSPSRPQLQRAPLRVSCAFNALPSQVLVAERGPLLFVFNFSPTGTYTDYK